MKSARDESPGFYLHCNAAISPGIRLKVKDDPYTELEKKCHKQWFYFRAAGEYLSCAVLERGMAEKVF